MTKLETIVEFETLCEKYDMAENAIKNLKRERLKIRSELLKVNSLLQKEISQEEKLSCVEDFCKIIKR